MNFSSGSRFLASGGHEGCVQVRTPQGACQGQGWGSETDELCAQIWDLKAQEVTQSYNISASAVTSVTFCGYKDEHVVAGSERCEQRTVLAVCLFVRLFV